MNKKIFLAFIMVMSVGIWTVSVPDAKAVTGWSYITLSTYYAYPDESFGVKGAGFEPGERVSVRAFGKSYEITADAGGEFSLSNMDIPYDSVASAVPVVASGNHGSTGSATLNVAGFYPDIQPSNYYILPGNTVVFKGDRYAPGETVTVTRDGVNIGSATTDMEGRFTTGNFAVGYSSGRQTYTFTGSKSKGSVSRTIMVSGAPPYILLSTYYARPGSSVVVTGRSFGSEERVLINAGGSVVATATTTRSGQFSVTATVPSNTSGVVQITATGQSTGALARAMFTTMPWYASFFSRI